MSECDREDWSVLADSLRSLYQSLADEIRRAWSRDLPFDEILFDRWDRAKVLGFGHGASIYHNSYVYGDVKVGENTWIGPFTLLDGTGGLSIGDWCSISAGVHIYTHDSVFWALSGGKVGYERAPVKIGDCSYIGSQSVIIKGVTIGRHCLVGAKSFVNEDLPDYSVAYGSPCRIVGQVALQEDGTVKLVHNS